VKIIVGDIIDNPGKSLRVNQDEAVDIPELKLLTPVHAALKLTSTGEGGISVKGTLKVQAELVCSRCAGPYAETLDIDIDELFLPKDSPELAAEPGKKEEVQADSLCVFAYDDDQLDLDEVMRQNILASLPFCPLCKEDCRGICAGCGVDLNNGVCTCSKEEESDPRWNVLKKFMDDKSSE